MQKIKERLYTRWLDWRAKVVEQGAAEELERQTQNNEAKNALFSKLFGEKQYQWVEQFREVIESLGGEISQGWLYKQNNLDFIVIFFKGTKGNVDMHQVRKLLQELDPEFTEAKFQKELGQDGFVRYQNLFKLARRAVVLMLNRDNIPFAEEQGGFYYEDIRILNPAEERFKQ